MDDARLPDFFRRPTQTLHRRYEALRACFLEHRPLAEVAQTFGYAYGTLRNLVAQFRAQYQAGHLPPFSANRHAAGRAAPAPLPGPRNRTSRLRLTSANSP